MKDEWKVVNLKAPAAYEIGEGGILTELDIAVPDAIMVVRTLDDGYREDWTLHENFETTETAQELADDLNELEAAKPLAAFGSELWQAVIEFISENGIEPDGTQKLLQVAEKYGFAKHEGFDPVKHEHLENAEWMGEGDLVWTWRPAPTDVPKEEGKTMKTYEEYQQAVYAEFQRVTGQDWSQSNIDVSEEYADGIPPAQVVAEQLSHGEPDDGSED